MANQLEVIKESNLGTIFEPATLEVHGFDEMKEMVKKVADKYTNLVFTADDKKDAEEVRSKLIDVRDKFERERKIIKKAYNEPLNEYESKIKELNGMIDVPLNQIREGLKEIDIAERELREECLKEVLGIKLEGLGVEIEPNKSWLNKGMWTSKLKPTTKLNQEIDYVIDAAIKEKDRKESEIKILSEFCKAKDIDPAGWISQLDFKSATEVIDLINLDIKRKAEIAAEQQKKKTEFESFQSKQAEVLAEIDQVQSYEDPFVQSTENFPVTPVIINVIRVKGSQSQLNNLNEYLISSGIEVEFVADETNKVFQDPSSKYLIDDLPF
ncbi:DUF1351 domain-containing protein [Desemzia sp. FAM 23989]|uniref:DUF1351 domain-containing protein n=1 Tax=Desemzia sp. FAM 23989 TaxID=3259523 RepID=UPI003885B772